MLFDLRSHLQLHLTKKNPTAIAKIFVGWVADPWSTLPQPTPTHVTKVKINLSYVGVPKVGVDFLSTIPTLPYSMRELVTALVLC